MRLFAQLSWYFRREWQRYLGAVALLIIIAILQLIPPKVVGYVVDGVTEQHYTTARVLMWVGTLVLTAVIVYLLRYVWRVLLGRVALLDPEKLGLGLTAFVLIKTQHHSSEWYCRFVNQVSDMPEVLGFWRMAGEYDYLMRVQVADMKRYDDFYKRLVNSVPGLSDVTSSFAMEQIKYTTALPIE